MSELVLFPFISRSGSTFFFSELSRHPDIFVCPEAEILMHRLLLAPETAPDDRARLVQNLTHDSLHDPKLSDWHLAADAVENACRQPRNIDIFVALVQAYRDSRKAAANVILFKGPRKLLRGCAALSDATCKTYSVRMLSIVRDGRAAYASQKTAVRPATGRPMLANPMVAAREWSEFVAGFTTISENRWQDRALLVFYEALISDTASELERVRQFLQLDPFPPLDVHSADMAARIPDSHKTLHQNIEKPPLVERINAWRSKLSASEIYWFEHSAAASLNYLGYELTGVKPSLVSRCLSRATFTLRHNWHRLLVYRTQRRLKGRRGLF